MVSKALPISDRIDICRDGPLIPCGYLSEHALVGVAFERIEFIPVISEMIRMKDVSRDLIAIVIQDNPRIPHFDAPSARIQVAFD